MFPSKISKRISSSVVNCCNSSVKLQLRSKFTLPGLDYDFGSLAPSISGQIMEIHHQKHHNTYVTNLNIAYEKLEDAKAKNDISAIIALQGAIKFNGGGHLNHSIFWKNLAPVGNGGGEMPSGDLITMIENQYGSLENFQTAFSSSSVGVQGSGWGWLGFDKASNRLSITTTANQDPLRATTGLVPLLGVDVWEHAYYLDYKNVRPDYLGAVWKVVNWTDVQNILIAAKKD